MKHMVMTLFFPLLLWGCGSDETSTASTQSSSQNLSPTALSIEKKDASFDMKQVLQRYGETPLKVLDISERSREGRNAIAVTLSVPLDPALDHQKYVNISAQKQGNVDGAWVLSSSGKTLWFPYTEPDTAYDITIYSGLVAANKQTLGQTKVAQLTTSQLTPSINFDTSGAFLTQGLGNGLPLVTVNIKDVDIHFFQIKPKAHHSFLQHMSNRRYYWNMDRASEYGDLVYSGRYALDPPQNTRVKRSIHIEGINELKGPGLYLAVMSLPGKYNKQQAMWFSVTDIGIHARFYDNQLDVFASSLKTGQAMEQVNISLINSKGEIVKQNLTSPEGQASFTGDLQSASLIVAKSSQHLSVIEINKPALDLSEFNLGLRPERPLELFIYGPRDLYRPGEFIDFSALLRDHDGRLTTETTLSASIKSPDGTKIKTFRWNGDQNSYYTYQWQIPTEAQVGSWQLEVNNVGNTPFIYDFKVEEFLPERLKLTLNPNHRRSVSGKDQPVSLEVQGEYLFGAPASGNRLSTEVITSHWRKPLENLPGFEFGDIHQTEFNRRTQTNDIQLDDQGNGEVHFTGDWSQLRSPLRVKFISSLYESGGRPVSRSHSNLVWPTEKMIGIRPDFGEHNPPANSMVSFEIIKTTLEGKTFPAPQLDVKLIREDRRYFWVYSDDQGWHYEWNDNEYIEYTTSLNIHADEMGNITLPVSWGRYRLEVRDPTDHLLTSIGFYAGENWYENWKKNQPGTGAPRPDKVTMVLDKAAYSTGDHVKVSIVPPQAGEAIIMVEGNIPLWTKRLPIPAEGTIVEIPVSPDWQQHNLYISAVVLQAGDQIKNITPKRSFGLVHLPLDREKRKLEVSFDVPDKVLPHTRLPVKVKITNPSGQPEAPLESKPYFVTLAAVDVGVLNIRNFKTPDPFDGFFGQRRYEVDARDVYSKIIEMSQADRANLRFGGDSDLSKGGNKPLSEVQIVSIFSGLTKLDEHGEAVISLNLPDFNGRIRLMALAFSDEQFGHGEQELTLAAPVVIQLAMPRFLAKGDTTHIALDITNLSQEHQELEVNLLAVGPVSAKTGTKTVSLKDGAKTTLTYPIKGTDFKGKATFSLQITGAKLEQDINREWHLGLRPAYPATITRKQKKLNQGESITLDQTLIDGLIESTLQTRIGISPVAHIDMQHQLTHLMQYPYGCLEQTSSRAYPLIFATPENQTLMGLNSISEDIRLDMINKGIERLATLQLSNGGYGLWNNHSREEHWLTAYVADFLLNARDMGVNVPNEMLSDTLKRLQHYLARSGYFYNERWSDDPAHYHFSYKAYGAYVLARVNQAPLGSLRHLANHPSRKGATGLSLTHLAIALFKMGDNKMGRALLTDALEHLPQKREKYYADYGSQLRDQALMIHLLLKHQHEEQQAIALSFTLAEHLSQRQYLSTQERNALFLAGLSLKARPDTPWSGELFINAAKHQLNQSAAYQHTLNRNPLTQGLTFTSTHDNPVLAGFTLSGYGKAPPPPSSSGLSIERSWLTIQGKEINLKQARVGELFLVHLNIRANQRTPDLMVIDLLPAGFELENQNLEHTVKLNEINIAGKSIAHWQRYQSIKHQEYRDDRYVAALEAPKDKNLHLFYLIRAVTPGVYQVPSPLAEDMYRPHIRGIGNASSSITITQK